MKIYPPKLTKKMLRFWDYQLKHGSTRLARLMAASCIIAAGKKLPKLKVVK